MTSIWKKLAWSTMLISCVATLAGTAAAQTVSRPTVIVQPKAAVKGKSISLGEIARIGATSPGHELVISKLKSVSLGDAPAPLTTLNLLAANILSAIEAAGIERDSIGYSIPNVVVIQRSGRDVLPDEVLPAAKEAIAADKNLDVQVREIKWPNTQVIPLGRATVTAEKLGRPSGGKIPMRVEVSVDGEPAARFLATALVDDWREVPVVERTLERGMLISGDDLQMVRLNLFNQPEDVVDSLTGVVGRRVLSTIQAGETVRRKSIEIPPVITKGKRVTMSYGEGAFFATASGVAQEDGLDGGWIRVKNDSSGKIIRARVVSPDEVEVGAK